MYLFNNNNKYYYYFILFYFLLLLLIIIILCVDYKTLLGDNPVVIKMRYEYLYRKHL